MKDISARAKFVIGLVVLVIAYLLRRYGLKIDWIDHSNKKPADKQKTSLLTKKKACAMPRKLKLFLRNVEEQDGMMESVEAITRLFPRRFELLGHVVVVKLNADVAVEDFARYAKAFAKTFLPTVVDVVLLDTGGINGELRLPQLLTLWVTDASCGATSREGLRFAPNQLKDQKQVLSEDLSLFETYMKTPSFTTCIENGVRYSFDVMKVMFCSGNGTERMHFANITAQDEVVVDMFAGIGYFTLPLAMFGSVKVIHALEKNSISVGFLKYNALQNSVDHVIRTYCGDNREVGEELCGQCDRVIMGYIPSCEGFLPRAISFLRKSAHGEPVGIIHYHFLSDKGTAAEVVRQTIRSELGDHLLSLMSITSIRKVKSYAPRRFHNVADLSFGKC